VTASHALTLLGSAAAAVAGMGADAARSAVVFLDPVTGGQAGKSMPLHGSRRAATPCGAHDVHCLHIGKDFAFGPNGPDLGVARGSQPEFTYMALGLAIRLGRQCFTGRRSRAAPLGFEIRRNVATLRPSRLPPGLVLVSELDRIVSVPITIADQE